MRVLIACEFSGTVREAFRKLGHDAWSCDLLPAEDGSTYHYKTDVIELLRFGPKWDLMIAHPPCTFLCGSGLHWIKRRPGRAEKTEQALDFVRSLLAANVPKIALENPVGCIGTRIRPADQTIQPYDFAADASKRTCLWLKGLPLLKGTEYIKPRLVTPWIKCPEDCGEFWCNLHRKHAHECDCKPIEEWKLDPYSPCIKRWGNQTDSGQNKLGPSEDRWAKRSITYPGIAKAMAEQWGRE